MAARDRLVAPALLPFEVMNAIWRYSLSAGIGGAAVLALLDRFFAVPVTLSPASVSEHFALHRAALGLAITYGFQAVYDAHYVALAEMLHCDLWTDDRRLLRALGGRLPYVRWIGEYPGDAATGA